MNILALDTATDILAIGLQTDTQFYECTVRDGLKHSEKLMPKIEQIMQEAKVAVADLDLVVCSKGPGSFTGLRIGISTAKGIALGAGCPVISIPALDVYAYPFSFFEGLVVPVIDARKKRFYTALYRNGEKISDYLDITPGKLLEMLEDHEKILFSGPDCSLFYSVMQKGVFFDRNQRSGSIESLIRLGLRQLEKTGEGDSDDSGPIYIRKSEAEKAMDAESAEK